MTETASSSDDLPAEGLPSDPEALRAFVLEIIAERDAAVARCTKLEHLLRVARNAQYGRSLEKLSADQLEFTETPSPSHPIARGRAGPQLLAEVLFAKYRAHLPLNRQSDIFAKEGVDLDVSTMAGWVGATAATLMP